LINLSNPNPYKNINLTLTLENEGQMI
jgi:hypothetical protein